MEVAMYFVLIMWVMTFIMLFLQIVGMVKCLKKYKMALFAYYIFIGVSVYVSQMMLWAGGGNGSNSCRLGKPVMWWWLLINVCLFYLLVTFGMATWGSYLCKNADAKEEII